VTDFLTQKERSKLMSKVRSRGSKIELKMKEALLEAGIEFVYQPKIFGRPDFLVFSKIAIFCDSSFWHGRNWRKLRTTLKKGYWHDHILSNRRRDVLVKKILSEQGYIVLRFWDTDINKKIDFCIRRIRESAYEQNSFDKDLPNSDSFM
jgi:DNA mismatch endonuclease, patch repair protein